MIASLLRAHPPPLPVLFFVEGIHDIGFFRSLSRILHAHDAAVPDLPVAELEGRLIFIPVGGDPRLWAQRFAPLGCQEMHIYDRETEPLTSLRQSAVDAVNSRVGCFATLTGRRSLEGYLHPQVIKEVCGVELAIGDDVDACEAVARARRVLRSDVPWDCLPRRSRLRLRYDAKIKLNSLAVAAMTPALLAESDPAGDVVGWLRVIAGMLTTAAITI